MCSKIDTLKSQLNAVECALECNYERIRIYHTRKQYEMAAPLFSMSSHLNGLAAQIKKQIEFYETVERLNAKGILTQVVKKVAVS